MRKTLSSFASLANLQRHITTSIFPRGGALQCTVCKRREEATPGECADYLTSGWPLCCRRTMRFTPYPPTKEGG